MSSEIKKTDFFWISYSDLLTSLFFVMLVLYAITFTILKTEQARYKAEAEELRKIKQIQKAVNGIDTTGRYFVYQPAYKKHILNIAIQFPVGKHDITLIDSEKRKALIEAGNLMKKQIAAIRQDDIDIKYLVIIEGQASRNQFKDHEMFNYKLSYERGLSLLNYWKSNDIEIGKGDLSNCELIIGGSGEHGEPRDTVTDANNQRFLIHIIPKVGAIDTTKVN